MFRWVRRVEAWLDAVGLRRTVLLAVGSAGLAAALVSGVAIGQLSTAVGAGRDRVGADPEPLRELVCQAAAESLTQSTATDAAVAQEYGRRFARTSRAVDDAVLAAAARRLTEGQRAALDRFGRSWQQLRDARPAGRGLAARGDRGGPARVARARFAPALAGALTALQAVDVSWLKAAQAGDLHARGAYYRAQLVLALLLAAGLAGTAALLRLGYQSAANRLRRWAAFLRGDAQDDAGREAVPAAGVAPAFTVQAGTDPGWWLRPGRSPSASG
ncbi:MAG TPA: hypothetical protein VI248_11800 [Kineosporiaceae bacterium]